MRSLDEIKQALKEINNDPICPVGHSSNSDKLDLIVELLIGLHEKQDEAIKRIIRQDVRLIHDSVNDFGGGS